MHLPIRPLPLIPAALLLALLPAAARADVKPAPIISDGMVLQRGMDARVFGTAAPGEKVSVTFRGRTAAAPAAQDGRWLVELPAGSAGGPWPLVIQGKNRIELNQVYVGDVWLCSGQSNMEWSVRQSTGAAAIAALPSNERLRLYHVTRQGAGQPAGWQAASPETIPNFSGVGYYFGRALQQDLKIPIGLIQSAVGGTPIERWTSVDRLRALGFERLPANAGDLHALMIRPLQPFGIKGVTWYQGESNAGNAANYRRMQQGMVQQWRDEWREGSFPFLFVQLARLGTPDNAVGDWPLLREAQRQAQSQPNTGMAVIFDVSDGNIHPPDKTSVGDRLALLARALVYGERIEYSGPVLESARREGDRIVLTFGHAIGLQAKGGSPRDLQLEVAAGDFRPATATIQGNQLIVTVGGVAGPVRVLYGWKQFPQGNLFNEADLPASPFATPPLE
jgi:sialate O-acetylesterase